MDDKQAPRRTFAALNIPLFIALFLILFPLVESLHGSVLWGLNFHSPKFMSKVGDVLGWIKLLMLCAGVILLFTRQSELRLLVKSKWVSIILSVVLAAVAFIQLALGLLGVMFDATQITDRDYIHKEFEMENNTIYVFTADPGAMGKAYHYFYLKCPRPLNRYELKLIEKARWVGDVELKTSSDGFDVFNQRGEFGYWVDFGGVECG